MRYMILLCVLCVAAAVGAEEATPVMKLRAEDVNFDGKQVHLAGSVYVEHTFGKLECEKAVLILEEKQQVGSAIARGFYPTRILLEGAVQVELHDGSSLTADDADIDCAKLEGVFTSDLSRKVVYISYVQEGFWRSKVKAESRALRLKMKRGEGKNPLYTFTDLHSEEAVHIEYESQKCEGAFND